MKHKRLCKNIKGLLILMVLLMASVVTNAQISNDTIQNMNHVTTDSINALNNSDFNLHDYFEPIEKTLRDGHSWAVPYSKYKIEIILLILVLSIILFVFGLVRNRRGEILEGKLHIINLIIICFIFFVELFYVMTLGANSTWFCKPAQMGWTWTIINFIIFGLVLINQIFRYLHTLRDLQYNSYAVFSWKLGLFSFPIALVLALIAAYFYKPIIPVIFILLLVVQLIQIFIIFRSVLPEGGIFHAILCSSVYLLGALATIVLVFHFIALFIAAIIIVGLIYIFIAGTTSGNSKTIKYCMHCGSELTLSGKCSTPWKHNQQNADYYIYCIYCGKKKDVCTCDK